MIGFSEILLAIFVALFINKKKDWNFYYHKLLEIRSDFEKYRDNFVKECELNLNSTVVNEVREISGNDGRKYKSYDLGFISGRKNKNTNDN